MTPDLLRRSFRVTGDPIKITIAIGLYPASTMSLLHVFYGKNEAVINDLNNTRPIEDVI